MVTGGRCFWQISEKTPLSPCPINIASVCEVTQWVGWTRVRLGAGIWQQDGAELVETWPLEEDTEANEEAMQPVLPLRLGLERASQRSCQELWGC